MTPEELITAKDAYARLTALQAYRSTIEVSPPVDVPPGLATYSLTLPSDIQDSVIAVVDAAVASAQADFDAL